MKQRHASGRRPPAVTATGTTASATGSASASGMVALPLALAVVAVHSVTQSLSDSDDSESVMVTPGMTRDNPSSRGQWHNLNLNPCLPVAVPLAAGTLPLWQYCPVTR